VPRLASAQRVPHVHEAVGNASTRPILGPPRRRGWGLLRSLPERGAVERALAKREAAGERRRETRAAETPDGAVDAWVWVSRGSNGGGETDLDALEARLRAAHGVVGTGIEYVRTVVHAMELHGIHDPLVATLWARLRG
jgi:cation transport regulator ChaC